MNNYSKTFIWGSVCAVFIALAAQPARAAIRVVSSGSAMAEGKHVLTNSFYAGFADKLVAVVIGESNASAGDVTVTYNGVAMTTSLAFEHSEIGLYYLDNPYAGGAADVVVTFDAGVGTVNGFALGVVSLAGTRDGGPVDLDFPGVSVTGGMEATVDVTHDGSFVIAGYNNNQGAITMDGALTPIFNNGGFGSLGAAIGYEEGVLSGSHTYRFLSGNARSVLAAAFAPDPRFIEFFADNFNRTANTDLNASTNGKSGLYASAEWLEGGDGTAVWGANDQLYVRTGGALWLDQNLIDLEYFTVTVDVTDIASSGEGRYAICEIGCSLGGGGAVSFAADDKGSTRGVYVFGRDLPGVYATSSITLPATLSATFTFDDMKQDSPINFTVSLNGAVVYSGTSSWAAKDRNYIRLTSNATTHSAFDNFSVYGKIRQPKGTVLVVR